MSQQFIKLLLIGDSGVGKSCLLARFCEDKFINAFYNTIGVDFKTKTIQLQGRKCKLQIWDTAGQQRFRTITANYYKGANGILVVFDLTNRQSLNNLDYWLTEVQKHANKETKLILVGNKCDMHEKRQVSEDEISRFSKDRNLIYVEASAFSAANVELVFQSVAKNILVSRKVKKPLGKGEQANTNAIIRETNKQKNKSCC